MKLYNILIFRLALALNKHWLKMPVLANTIKLTQNFVCFTNPCINPVVPTSVIREYHPKVLEHLHLLQCVSAHLQKTLPWSSSETQYLNLFRADFGPSWSHAAENRSNAY